MQTDYLVIGAGLGGLCFADMLLDADEDSEIVLVDRRHAPGGHWLDVYPFVRLHQPSRLYGVNSMPPSPERTVRSLEAGRYERASGSEICGYFDRVMQQRLLASGRVRFLPHHEYLGAQGVHSLMTGKIEPVRVRKRLVDASYLESGVPATHAAPFEVAEGARCVPAGALAALTEQPEAFVVIGGGKTALDTCVWLLQQGVDPERIRWVRPRDIWLLHRNCFEGGDFVDRVMQGAVAQLEAGAETRNAQAWFEYCEAKGVMTRIDRNEPATMMRGATCDDWEIELLASIEQVIRLGQVQRIETDRIVLQRGEVPTSPNQLHVHCAAYGVPDKPPVPIFQPDAIRLQMTRAGSPSFSYSQIALVEASGRDDDEKNQLVQPNTLPSTPLDWIRSFAAGMAQEGNWSKASDVAAWMRGSRLNIMQGVEDLAANPEYGALFQRFGAAAAPGMQGMQAMLAQASDAERARFWPPANGRVATQVSC